MSHHGSSAHQAGLPCRFAHHDPYFVHPVGDTIRVKKKDSSVVAVFSYSFEHGYWVR